MGSGTAALEAHVTGKPTECHGNRMPSADWAPHGAYPCCGTDEWIAIAVQTDEQLWASVRFPEENIDDPHLQARGTFQLLTHPETRPRSLLPGLRRD